MTYQLSCTLIACFLNIILIVLIQTKSPSQTGRYKYLMLFTAGFEVFWAIFDLPAAINAHSVGSAFIVFRIDYPDSWIPRDFSPFIIVIYTAIFGASMAIFASHFTYRYGAIDRDFGKKFTSGWKFGILFVIPAVYSVWWGAVVYVWFWSNEEMTDYTRELVWRSVKVDIGNISYIGSRFWNIENGTMSLNPPAWIGVGQMMFMVSSSMTCVFGLGFMCYSQLSSQLSIASSLDSQLQKQLFYALVVQTAIPLILMHIPITVYFVCPMLNMDFDFASEFMAHLITLYPAVDPLPNFFIIKSYRNAIIDVFERMYGMIRKKPSSQVVPHNSIAMSQISRNSQNSQSIA